MQLLDAPSGAHADVRRSPRLLFRSPALALVLLLLLSVRLDAQSSGTLRGQVLNAEGAPLADVQLFVEGTVASALSGPDGRFVLTGVPAGERTLVLERLGYGTVRRTVGLTSGSNAPITITLETSAISIPGVIVTATRDARPLDEVAAAVGVIDRGLLEEVRPSHPSEIMGKVPGVWVNVTGGEGHMTAIRQPLSTSPLYLYLENGVPTRSTGFFNHNALYEINVPQADRIEVMKGPANALYGSDAIGGVVNVETRPPVVGEGISGSVEGGSWGYSRILGSLSGQVGEANAIRLEANYTRTDGWRAGTGYDRVSGTARWDRSLGDWSMKAMATFSTIDQNTAGSSALSESDFEEEPRTNYTPISFREVGAVRVSSEFARETDGGSLTITPFFRSNSMDILPNWSLTFDPAIWETSNRSFGVLTKWRRDVGERGFVIAGLDLDWSPGEHRERSIVPERENGIFVDYDEGAPLYDYDVTFRQASPYLHAEFAATSRLRVSGGLRVDVMGYEYENGLSVVETGSHRRPADASPSFTSVSPKVGATYSLSEGASLFGSYRRGFRAPSEGQLFRQGSAENTVDLDPELTNSFEAGIRGRIGSRVRAELTAYTMDVFDAVLGFRLPSGATENQNAGRTRHRGVEAGLGALLSEGLELDVAASYAKHTYEDWQPREDQQLSGAEMESAPQTIGNAELRWTPAFLPSVSTALEWTHLGSYYLDPANEQEYEGHDLLGARLSWDAAGGVRVFARVHNLTDERYAERASFNAFRGVELAPGLPRTLYVGVEVR